MKLDRLQELVTTFAITLSGILVAVFLGLWAGRGDQKHIAILLGSLAFLLLFFKMRQHIWMLIPLTAPLAGRCAMLPLPFSLKQLGLLVVFAAFLILIALKIVQVRPKYDLLDLIVLANILYSATVYVRNPIGTLAIGSDRIGGKPYVDLILGILGYWTLCRVVATPSQLLKIPYLIFSGTAAVTSLSVISTLIPSSAPILSKLYNGVDTSAFDEENPDNLQQDAGYGPEQGVGRLTFFSGIGSATCSILISYFRPSTLINPFYLFRFSAFMLSLVAVLVSGYRSGLIGLAAIFLISCYLQERLGGFFRLSLVLGVAFTIVLLGQGNLYELPLNVQRTLSFLPGKWNPVALADAQASVEWRQVMWKKAMGNSLLGSTKYIKSKLLGDGPGFDRVEFANFKRVGAGSEGQQEDLLIAGAFHSGPISTIRNVGLLGGILFYFLMFHTAYRGYQLIERTRGTPFFPMALYVGVPILVGPFAFTFIFGAFETGFPETIMAVGFLKMISQSLEAHHLFQRADDKNSGAKLVAGNIRPAPAFAGSPLANGSAAGLAAGNERWK